jgi:hypothetical protein
MTLFTSLNGICGFSWISQAKETNILSQLFQEIVRVLTSPWMDWLSLRGIFNSLFVFLTTPPCLIIK